MIKLPKKEVAARKEAEVEQDTTVKHACQRTKSLPEAEKNFVKASTVVSQVGILQGKLS